jgi:dTDP-4-amino-4,6-dideoxygalactose transaminase
MSSRPASAAPAPSRLVFNQAYVTGRELDYVAQACAEGHLSGDGRFTRSCQRWLEQATGCSKALLTHSCTGALELAALLLDLQPGDEVIMPSFTFVSTANAFVLRGAIPVFVDIRADTCNLDEQQIAAAVTARTRAIVVVHYAGVACDMAAICALAEQHGLWVVEDAAHALLSTFRGRPLGSIGHLATLSFHETKNVTCGEGGALLVNHPQFVARAEILREKGTNRASFVRSEVERYTWVDLGSSLLLGEMSAAFLLAQLEHAQEITARRLALWHAYFDGLEPLAASGWLRRPVVPADCATNAHLFHLRLARGQDRAAVLKALRERGIQAVFHYVPLHSAPAGRRFGRSSGPLAVTDEVAATLVRLPLWLGMEDRQPEVIEALAATAD